MQSIVTKSLARVPADFAVAAPQASEEFQQFLEQELAKWNKVTRSAGIKVE